MRRRGLTLAELLLSLGVASLSVLLVFEMITAGLAHYRKLEVIGTAQALAEGKMEELVARDVYSLADSAGDFPPPHQDYSYAVKVTAHGPAVVKNVNVTVTHELGTRRSLATLRAPNSTPPGLALFFKLECNNCHSISGLVAGPTGIAPDLAPIGLQPKAYIRSSIEDPNANFGSITNDDYKIDTDGDGTLDSSAMQGAVPVVTPEEVTALADWLYSLTPP